MHGVWFNNGAFADDMAIYASNAPNLKQLLRTCEHWSKVVGMEYAQAKCVLLSQTTEPQDWTLYGLAISTTTEHDYLGIPVTVKGFNFIKNSIDRSSKARTVSGR